MRRKLNWLLALGTVVLLAMAYGRNIQATPSSGFSASTIAVGRVPEFDVTHNLVSEQADERGRRNVWLSLQKTKGLSDLYVQSNVWQPGGGTSGWHTHPGHSLVTVTAGAVTNYDGDDPSCTPTVYTVGMTFVDHGGDHAHLVRNEGSVEARSVAVQLIPAGATRRVDHPGNPACPF